MDVTLERLRAVITGKMSNGKKTTWEFSKKNPYLSANCIHVFNVEYTELTLNDFEKAKKLIPEAEKQFKALNPKYTIKNRFDLYNELAALNPYKKD